MTDRIEEIIRAALLQPCENHADRAALARETARQVREAAPAGVTLKPLEWVIRDDGCHVSTTSIGRYMIFPGTGYSYDLCGTVGGTLGVHKRLDSAKAAAQTDYEQRIRDCANLSPSYSDGVKEGLRRADEAHLLPRGSDKGGWTLSICDLKKIRENSGEYGETCELETVEAIALSVEWFLLSLQSKEEGE